MSTLDDVEGFATMIARVKNPRAKRAFLDSFYARIMRDDIHTMNPDAIKASAILLEQYNFLNHANNLWNHPQLFGCAMPGAERFANYLRGLCGELTTVEQKQSGKYRSWTVKRFDDIIGEYHAYDKQQGDDDCRKEYHGKVQGYVNQAIVDENTKKEKKDPIDRVVLSYTKFQTHPAFWGRNDCHNIPFP